MSIFQGSGVALITPFTYDDEVNFKTLEKLIEFQVKGGTDALIVCGTTGEPSTMSLEERDTVIGFAVEKVDERIPVIAGTGGNNTIEVLEASRRAQNLGADALLIVTPYYNKCTQEGLIAHFFTVADAVEIPIIVYNVPSRTALNITPETMAEIATHPNIVAVKEASANIAQITELARLCPKLDIYSGNDDHVVPLLSLGAKGVISVTANVLPKDVHDMCARWFAGDIAGARELQFYLNPLTNVLFSEVSPIPVKTAVSLIGYDAGPLRMPLTPMSDANLQKLILTLVDYGFNI